MPAAIAGAEHPFGALGAAHRHVGAGRPVEIADEMQAQTGRSVSISAVHAALQRLEEKGMLRSAFGEATQERGGRRKRLFTVTTLGGQALESIRDMRSKLWESIFSKGLLVQGI